MKNNSSVKEKQYSVEAKLKNNATISKEELFRNFETSIDGLSVVNLEDIDEKYGKNTIEFGNNYTIWNRLRDSLFNPFNIVLLLVAAVTFVTDVVIATQKDYITFVLLISTVLISAAVSFIQETKSDNAAKKLKSMISNKMDVIRDGNACVVDVTEVYPGDIVKLSSGDMIPGDVRFIETKDLFIDQASLTGESVPVEKFVTLKQYDSVTDISNIGFMGTNIISGSALAVVIATGSNTYFGAMAKSLYTVKKTNSFDEGINGISNLLIHFMIVMIPIIMVINMYTKSDVLSSLIFAITIAVGLTPEMFPVIMTSTMVKGAVEMSKKKTIVKRVNAIQTFGQMDILCTDKTGTLTEDEVILEKYMDVNGNESLRILKHAFLNSYFQTGLKNLIDVAIISRADKEKMNVLKEKYVREDEIPFKKTTYYKRCCR